MTSLDGRVRSGAPEPDDAPAAEDPDAGEHDPAPEQAGTGSEVVGADAATVRRARPSRAGPADGVPAAFPADPPRRPVPPTFPSPGQPPPGVARRAGRHAR